jgi:hypothetical protein
MEGGHVTMEIETGMMVRNTNNCQQSPELGKIKKGSSIEPLGGAEPCRHLEFRLLATRTEENQFLLF